MRHRSPADASRCVDNDRDRRRWSRARSARTGRRLTSEGAGPDDACHTRKSMSSAETLPRSLNTNTSLPIRTRYFPGRPALAFVGRRGTTDQFMSALDRREAVALAGTDGAYNPFFFSRRPVDWLQGRRRPETVAVDGGRRYRYAGPGGLSAPAGSDETIVFGNGGGLMRCPPAEECLRTDEARSRCRRSRPSAAALCARREGRTVHNHGTPSIRE